jgi:hypothetical protein
LCFEVLAVLFALFVHAPHSAELPSFAVVVALGVLVFLIVRYRRLKAAEL